MSVAAQTFALRNALAAAVRQFFGQRNFLEVETPILVPCPGTEPHLEYFASDWRDARRQKHRVFLRSSPELHMKQLLAAGHSRIFQIAPCFRNHGEMGPWHHPQFSMLEWYETGIDFYSYMDQTLDLLRETCDQMRTNFNDSIVFQVPKSVPRFSVAEAIAASCRIQLVDGDPDLATKARTAGVTSVNTDDNFETAFFKIMLECVEPFLARHPLSILHSYPASQAALAKVEGGIAQRFEIYAQHVELCNAFHELTDAVENRRRFEDSQRHRAQQGATQIHEDPDFWDALDAGLPPSCGNALGLDRWLAILLGVPGLDQVVPFRQALPFRTGVFGSTIDHRS